MTIRIPDPKANTTTEAYLAYKAGVLEESELKPKLYEPYLHFDGWLAYWTGLTDTYPTDENGGPEMLCDEEACVAYLASVTDTYPKEIKDPYDVRLVGYLKHLIGAKWEMPELQLNNSELYLSMLKTATVSSGDPSSNIDMENTAEAPFDSLEVYGDTTQVTYSGKNLIVYPYTDGVTKSSRGIIFTVADDGTITLEGKNNGTGNASYNLFYNPGSPTIIPTGTYYFIPTPNQDIEYAMYDGDKYYTINHNNNYSVTFSSDASIIQIYVQVRNGVQTTFNGEKVYPMLSTLPNQTEADYEPYVGVTPSPNPDYPQNVNVVAGEQTVYIHGKNLLQNTLFTEPTVKGNVTITPNADGTFTLDGVCNSSQWTNFANDSIYPAFNGAAGGTSETTIDGYTFSWSTSDNTSIRITHNANTGIWAMRVISGQVYDNTVVKYQLEENQRATSWEPYQGSTYAIDLGAIELCKIGEYQDYIYKSGDDWYLHKETGKDTLPTSGYTQWGTADKVYSQNYEPTGCLFRSGETSGLCTNLTTVSQHDYITGVNDEFDSKGLLYGLGLKVRTKGIVIKNNDTTTLSDFHTWIAANPVTLYYPLETATDTQITDAALIGQLDAIVEGGSCQGETIITVTANGDNLPALLKVEAVRYE